jgi:hypothetical protein
MKTLNIIAVTFFTILFLAEWMCSWSNPLAIPMAALIAFIVVAPLYLMGLVLRWFVRALVK